MNGWAALSLVLTIVFGFLSVLFYIRSRRHKRLTFTYDRSELHTRTHPDIKILFKDRQVENLSRLRAACWNSGNQAVRGEDIPKNGDRAVVLSDARVLSVAHVGSSVDTAFIAEQLDEQSVSVRFSFLNPGDSVLFEILYEATSAKEPTIQFTSRVIGGRPTEARLFTGPLTPAESFATFLPLALCLLVGYFSMDFVRASTRFSGDTLTIGIGAVGLVLLLLIGAL